MKKETVIAIILGIGLGSVIAVTLIFSTHKTEISEKKVINTKDTPTVINFPSTTSEFTVIEPLNNTSTTKDTITVKGKAPSNSLVVIQSKTTEKIVKAENNLFSIDMPITLGENSMVITVYTDTTVNDKTVTVYRISEE